MTTQYRKYGSKVLLSGKSTQEWFVNQLKSAVLHVSFSQTQNDFLQDWKNNARGIHLAMLVGLEAPPQDHQCISCTHSPGCYRCLDCGLGQRLICKSCCIKLHQNMPFHQIKKWTGKFFDQADLGDLGLTINLGHDGGLCPMQLKHSDEVEEWIDEDNISLASNDTECTEKKSVFSDHKMVFVDSSGICKREVKWCLCSTAAPHHLQLLQMRFFPATLTNPSTSFTFRVLDLFHIEAMECKTAALNFYSKLKRLTNNSLPHTVPVSVVYFAHQQLVIK